MHHHVNAVVDFFFNSDCNSFGFMQIPHKKLFFVTCHFKMRTISSQFVWFLVSMFCNYEKYDTANIRHKFASLMGYANGLLLRRSNERNREIGNKRKFTSSPSPGRTLI